MHIFFLFDTAKVGGLSFSGKFSFAKVSIVAIVFTESLPSVFIMAKMSRRYWAKREKSVFLRDKREYLCIAEKKN